MFSKQFTGLGKCGHSHCLEVQVQFCPIKGKKVPEGEITLVKHNLTIRINGNI
jgi:hypothetical protein